MSGGFVARDPDFADRIRSSFGRQAMMRTIGATLDEVAPGLVAIRLPRSDGILQQHGFIHGGVVATIGDTAAGCAALTLMSADQGVLTVEFKINLMAPARQPVLLARGRVVRPGRTLTVAEAEIVGVEDGREVTIAVVLATMMTIAGRPDVVG